MRGTTSAGVDAIESALVSQFQGLFDFVTRCERQNAL
jgi:hypothetical protein